MHRSNDYKVDRAEWRRSNVVAELSDHGTACIGQNRSRGRVNQLGVEDDVEAMRAWLDEHRGEASTYRAYLREAERLLLWSRIEGASLSTLTRNDFDRYHAFLLDPQPRSAWCGKRVPKFHSDGRLNPQWRPFTGPMTVASARQALRILNSLFTYLVHGGFLDGNPLAIMKGSRRAGHSERRTARAEKVMSTQMVESIWRAIEALPSDSTHQRRAQCRARWLMVCGFYLGARISEIAEHPMGSFRRNHDPDGKVRWWWHAHGKGGKLGTVPLPDQFVDELRSYREVLGLAPLPTPDEPMPLVGTTDGHVSATASDLSERDLGGRRSARAEGHP